VEDEEYAAENIKWKSSSRIGTMRMMWKLGKMKNHNCNGNVDDGDRKVMLIMMNIIR
jgi:hypothetical protein